MRTGGSVGVSTSTSTYDRSIRQAFYKTQAWQKCRDAYVASVGGLCERCKARGLIVSGEIVHHKIPLTPENVDNPDISLSFDNLELLCRVCHGRAHRSTPIRYEISDDGSVEVIGDEQK